MRNFLIDLDGVHYSTSYVSEPSILTAALSTLKKLNFPMEAEQALIEESKTCKNYDLYHPFEEIADGDDNMMNVFNHEIVKITDYSKIPQNPTLFAAIKRLQLKYNVIIITDNSKPHTQEVFKALWGKDIEESAIDIYSIEDAKMGKYYLAKREGGLELFCKTRAIDPAECFFIDDNIANIKAANALGMKTLHFNEDMDIVNVLTECYNKNG